MNRLWSTYSKLNRCASILSSSGKNNWDPTLVTSHERNMLAGPSTGWRQVQQSFPMNSDLTRAVYIKCWEKLLVSTYKPQLTAVKAEWVSGVRKVKPLLDKEKSKADINIQRNVQYEYSFSLTALSDRNLSAARGLILSKSNNSTT